MKLRPRRRLAGILKDPDSAGRIIAEAITHAETPVAAAKAHEAEAGPKSETGADPKVAAKAKTPSDFSPKIAKLANELNQQKDS